MQKKSRGSSRKCAFTPGYVSPKQIAIEGFEPSLSGVDQPTYEMGRVAAQLLSEQSNSTGDIQPKTIVMDGKLIIMNYSIRK